MLVWFHLPSFLAFGWSWWQEAGWRARLRERHDRRCGWRAREPRGAFAAKGNGDSGAEYGMRVILRHTRSHLLFQGPEQWTDDPVKAQAFKHSAEAMDYARHNELKDVEVLLAFEDPQFNVSLKLPALGS